VTISVGLVAIGNGEQLPWEVVLNQADTALYQAKANGRNRVALGAVNSVGLAPNPDVPNIAMDRMPHLPDDEDDDGAGLPPA
jgi:hypothetical protein